MDAGVVSVTLVGILEVGLVLVLSISITSVKLPVSFESMMIFPSDLDVSLKWL